MVFMDTIQEASGARQPGGACCYTAGAVQHAHEGKEEGRNMQYAPDPRAVLLHRQHAAYQRLGAEHDMQIADLYRQMAYGTVAHAVEVGNTTYSTREIHEMTQEQRVQLAEVFMEEGGLLDDYYAYLDRQHAWLAREENRPYLQYMHWRQGVQDYEGGPEQYWQDLIAENAAARHYHESVEALDRWVIADGEELMSLAAFMHAQGIQASAFDRTYPGSIQISDPLGILNQG